MRLDVLDSGHRLRARLFLTVTSRMSGVDMSDVPKTLLYRPELFGRALLDLSVAMMRGPSFWTAGEREYIAMRSAEWNRSPYCAATHTEMVRIAGTGEIDPDDSGSARPELTAVLGLLETVSRTPDRVSAADFGAVRGAGVPDDAILDALHVNLIWNVVNRLANAFDCQLRPGQLEKGTRSLHRFGYKFPAFLTRTKNRTVHTGTGDRRAAFVADLRRSVFDSPGVTDPAIRIAAATGGTLPEPLATYAATVRDASDRITDADIEALRAAGHSQDEIVDVTVAAAVGAALRNLDAALAARSG